MTEAGMSHPLTGKATNGDGQNGQAPSLAHVSSQMPEFSSQIPEKSPLSASPAKGRSRIARCSEEEEARIAENRHARENLARIARISDEPNLPIEKAITRAHAVIRWRTRGYIKRIWYGEIVDIPAHLARRLDELAMQADEERLQSIERQANALRRRLGRAEDQATSCSS